MNIDHANLPSLIKGFISTYLLIDSDLKVTHLNLEASAFFGHAADKLIGRPVTELLEGKNLGPFIDKLRKGESTLNNKLFIKKDGAELESIPLYICAFRLSGQDGEPWMILSLKPAPLVPIPSDLLVENIPDGLFTVDDNFVITSFNKAAEDITGWSAKEVLGRPCKEIFDSNLCGTGCILAKSIKECRTIRSHIAFITKKDGTKVPVTISTSPYFNVMGDVAGGVETFRNITDFLQGQMILDNIADGVFAVDKDWRITSFNAAAERITGYSQEEARGKFCHEIFHSSICGEKCPIAQTIRSGVPVHNRSVIFERLDGKRVPVSISASPLLDDMGNVIGGVETFRDLSALNALRKQLNQRYTFGDIISKSKAMRQIFDILPDIARSDSNVLILGESGTGKELIARAIHTISPRRKGPFVAVNCGALPDTLLESELFGYKAGAFTDAKRDRQGRFAAAQGGTIFLDEIGDISPSLQVKLLRVLQEKAYQPLGSDKTVEADVRILAATNRDLAALVKEGLFREDLFYRLNVVKIALPPLRERLEDIPLLVQHFIEKFNAEKGKEILGITDEALDLLMRHQYPGNIRELENIIEYAFILCHEAFIRPEHLPEPFNAPHDLTDTAALGLGRPMSLEEIEKRAILNALERNRWKKLATCKELGISKDTLRRKIRKYKLDDMKI